MVGRTKYFVQRDRFGTIHLNERQFYFNMGKWKGMEEIRKEKEVVRNKYLNYVKKFNEVNDAYNTIKQEIDTTQHKFVATKQELDTIQHENVAIKQENNALKQVLDCVKKEIIEVKQENEDIKEEYDEAEYMLESMMCRINRLAEENEQLAVENERLTNKSEKAPEKYDFPYQVSENSYPSIAIKSISNLPTHPSPAESKIQNLTKLKTETPIWIDLVNGKNG